MFFPDLDPGPLADDRPRYNIAPTQPVACVLRDSPGQMPSASKLRWGLVPPWAEDLNIGNRMINARQETIDTKPSFKQAFARRRCLIVADGYFEWKRTGDDKQPYLIEQPGGAPMALAGLWEANRRAGNDGEAIRTCTIITTAASDATKSIHDRMPVILEPHRLDRWIDPAFRDTQKLKSWLVPNQGSQLRVTPLSNHVNNPRHDDARCVEPLC